MMIVLSVNRLCIRWVVTSLTRVKAPTSLTHTVLGSSGAHPNQMKQVKMILKAQEVHFELHNSAQHRYEVDMTNDGLRAFPDIFSKSRLAGAREPTMQLSSLRLTLW